MQFAIKDAGNVIIVNNTNKEIVTVTETPNKFDYKMDAESVYAKAKGSNYIGFEGAKTATLTIEQEVTDYNTLALMMNSEVVKEEAEIAKKFVGKADGSKKVRVLGSKFVSGSAKAFKVEADGASMGEEIKGSFAQESDDIVFTATGDLAENTEVMIIYLTKLPNIKKIKVTNSAKSYSYKVYAEVAVKFADGTYMALNATYHNCRPQGNIEFGFDAENPVNFSLTMDVLPNAKGEFLEFAFVEETLRDDVMAMFSTPRTAKTK